MGVGVALAAGLALQKSSSCIVVVVVVVVEVVVGPRRVLRRGVFGLCFEGWGVGGWGAVSFTSDITLTSP